MYNTFYLIYYTLYLMYDIFLVILVSYYLVWTYVGILMYNILIYFLMYNTFQKGIIGFF